MPVTMQIEENGRIIHITTSDPYTIQEFPPLFRREREYRNAFLIEHPGQKVHMLIDMTKARTAATGFLRARDTPGLNHPTSGNIVLVGAIPLIRVLSETVFKLTRFSRVQFTDTLEQGMAALREKIQEQDSALQETNEKP